MAAYVPDEDVDPYEYFVDLEYLSDGYYDDRADINVRRKGKRKLQERRKKAKSQAPASQPNKRQRTTGTSKSSSDQHWEPWDRPNVIFVPRSERSRDPSSYISTTKNVKLPTVALLKDWRERFEGQRGLSMKPSRAAQFPSDTTVSIRSGARAALEHNASVEEQMDEENEEEDDEEGLDDDGLKEIAGMLDDGHKAELLKMLEAKVSTPCRRDKSHALMICVGYRPRYAGAGYARFERGEAARVRRRG